jgi:hypothetical protein
LLGNKYHQKKKLLATLLLYQAIKDKIKSLSVPCSKTLNIEEMKNDKLDYVYTDI